MSGLEIDLQISTVFHQAKPFCEGTLFVAIPLKCEQKCTMKRDVFCKLKLVKNKHFLQKNLFFRLLASKYPTCLDTLRREAKVMILTQNLT